jgi:hypothetical protein
LAPLVALAGPDIREKILAHRLPTFQTTTPVIVAEWRHGFGGWRSPASEKA